MKRLAEQIDKVYKQADYVGSLVVPEGEARPTFWDGATTAPATLAWRDFAGLRERYARYGWAGVIYRKDMSAGIYQDPPGLGATLLAEGCLAALAPIFNL